MVGQYDDEGIMGWWIFLIDRKHYSRGGYCVR